MRRPLGAIPDRPSDHLGKHPEHGARSPVLAAFAFQAVGVLTGTAIGYCLANRPTWKLCA